MLLNWLKRNVEISNTRDHEHREYTVFKNSSFVNTNILYVIKPTRILLII